MTYDLKPVYLDHNATSPLRPEVKQATDELAGTPLNPSSVHAPGRYARKIVEESRKSVLASVNAESLVFCGSGTETNNLALAQFRDLLVSEIEHDSVYKAPGAKHIRVNSNGVIDLNDLTSKLRNSETPKLISVMLANNETGVIQPIREVVEIAKKYGALVHTDAIQAYGRIPIDFAALGVDFMTISAHKAGGPVGAAALVHRADLELKPIMFGGGQEKNKRPGTENVAATHGFGRLAKLICEAGAEPALSVPEAQPIGGAAAPHGGKNKIVSRETIHPPLSPLIGGMKGGYGEIESLRDYLESEVKKAGGHCIGEMSVERLPNTSSIVMPGVEAATQLIHFDMANICVSAGSACSSGKVEISRVLKAIDPENAPFAIRVSLGWNSQKSDVERFVDEWKKLYFKNGKKAA